MRGAGRRVAYLLASMLGIIVATRTVQAFRRLVGPATSGAPFSSLTAPGEAPASSDSAVARVVINDTLLGRSGALRFAALSRAEALSVPGFLEVFGEAALHRASSLRVASKAGPFTLFVLVPFGAKHGEYFNGYRLGEWPAERWLMARNYYNPDGLVEVTPANVGVPLSVHFVLGEFVTHDQAAVWPKYVVLEERLIDKLELVLQDLAARGDAADHPVVLSGFRAPYHNEQGADEGMARASRHQYGDAADLILDHDGDGRMDDLNGDGREDLRDIRPLEQAIADVERAYPELTGGLGAYAAMGPRGPFVHVDVRGTRARWARAEAVGRRP